MEQTFEELITSEEFIKTLNTAATYEEAEAICAEKGFDLQKELAPVSGIELSEEDLNGVAGGITWSQAKDAWNFGVQAGVVIRNLWDKSHGKPLSYPNWRFEW